MNRFIKRTIKASLPALLLLLSLTAAAQQAPGRRGPAVGPASDRKTESAKAPASISQRFEKDGVVINFSLLPRPTEKGGVGRLVAGADAVATFRVEDARTGQPLAGLHPSAWINARKSEQPPGEAQCRDQIRSLMGGLLSTRADIDLNTYLLLTLNHDNTVSVINPQVSFSKTKLESIITLPGPGADWVLSQNKEFLYLTLPEQSAVGVINTVTRKLVATIPLGTGTKPMRIALRPGGRYVWAGLDGSPLVAVIDTANNKLVASVPVGAGLHNIAFVPDGQMAFVTNSAADTVSIIDAQTLSKLADIKVDKTPVPVAYSSASRLVYVASINGGTVSVIDPAKRQVLTRVPVKRGVVALRFEPTGRFGFIVNQVESTVSVLDASTNTITGTTAVVKEPDQVTFTARYAYIRGTGSEKFSLIETTGIASGKLAAVDVVAGRLAARTLPEEIGVADMIAPTPEGNAAMIANTADQMIYYYVEGMMAPMGTFSNYKRRPHALLLLDRSLSEVSPGVYSTPLRLGHAGRFDVPFLIDQPRIVNCFQLEVGESPDGEKTQGGVPIAVEPLFKDRQFKPQETTPLRFRITDSVTGRAIPGLTDVLVLVFEPPGIWQQRQFAKEVEAGVYEVTQAFPREGVYNVMVGVSSRGTTFADLPFTAVSVVNSPQPKEQKNGGTQKETKNE
ncbi:MAG TPA: YncE family protein [Pyrinomonadaceae bacterium]|jgi:YVTN family beta-propeller protein